MRSSVVVLVLVEVEGASGNARGFLVLGVVCEVVVLGEGEFGSGEADVEVDVEVDILNVCCCRLGRIREKPGVRRGRNRAII